MVGLCPKSIGITMRTNWLTLIATLSGFAFALNLPWEFIQCGLFFVHGTIPPTYGGMVLSSFGDVLITWLIFGLCAAWTRDARWIKCEPKKWPWGLIVLLCLTISVAIEIYALATGRWSYKPAAPLLPVLKVSIIPILQLLVLVPLSYLASRYVVWRKA